MKDARIVWSDEGGDQRKAKSDQSQAKPVQESLLELKLRRLTSGKGRTVIEITGLPDNPKWCKDFASKLKKSLGVGGAFKQDFIEIHIAELEKVSAQLDKKKLRWKKTGG